MLLTSMHKNHFFLIIFNKNVGGQKKGVLLEFLLLSYRVYLYKSCIVI